MILGGFRTKHGAAVRVAGFKGTPIRVVVGAGPGERQEDWPSVQDAVDRVQALCGLASDAPELAALRSALSFTLPKAEVTCG